MKRAALAVWCCLVLVSSGRAQQAQTPADQANPPAAAELPTCKPYPACRLTLTPLVPSAPPGALKAQGRRLDDLQIKEWAGRGPIDPHSFRLPSQRET